MFKHVTSLLYSVIIVLLIGIAVLATLSAFPIGNGFRIFVVQSGSMEPAIQTKSVVAVVPQERYSVGDIITFKSDPEADLNNPRATITHRLIEERTENSEQLYITKGDANNSADVSPIRSDQIVGKVVLTVPFLGYPVGFAKTQMGFIFLVVIPATLIIYSEFMTILKELKRIIKNKKGKKAEAPESSSDDTSSGHSVSIKSIIVVPLVVSLLTMLTSVSSLTTARFSDVSQLNGFQIAFADEFDNEEIEESSIELRSLNVLGFSTNMYDFESDLNLIEPESHSSSDNQDESETQHSQNSESESESESNEQSEQEADETDGSTEDQDNSSNPNDENNSSDTPQNESDLEENIDAQQPQVNIDITNSYVTVSLEEAVGFDNAEFEVLYQHTTPDGTITEAIQGEFVLNDGEGSSQPLLLGTCSDGGLVCVYHQNTQLLSYTVMLSSVDGSIIIEKEMGIE